VSKTTYPLAPSNDGASHGPTQRTSHPQARHSRAAALTITHANAAGIDIGSASHFVAVPPDRDDESVREFPSFTVDLNALADWLQACRVDTVAMESNGVYWIALFELLESRGFTVLLVNARQVKNVSGRKSDVVDCQWLQQLMTYICSRSSRRWVRSTSWARSWPSATPRSSCSCSACKFTTASPPRAQGQEARPRTQCAEVRSAHAAVQNVRRGPSRASTAWT
jgi:Transposase